MNTKNISRYFVPSDEDIEPNSDGFVLKNFLGIKNLEQINAIEEQELERTELELQEIFDKNHQFKAEDICSIHKQWLGKIYPSAGKYRLVF